MAAVLYSLVRVVLDAVATSHSNEATLKAEVLALRRQVQVLERQIKRVQWEPGDRLVLPALQERLPRSAWAALLVRPETVLAGIGNWFGGGGQRTEVARGRAGRRWTRK